jgi:hypothetical protein
MAAQTTGTSETTVTTSAVRPGLMIRGLAWDVGLPLLAYYGLHQLGINDWTALLAATAAAALRIVWVALRDRALNLFATVMLVVSAWAWCSVWSAGTHGSCCSRVRSSPVRLA